MRVARKLLMVLLRGREDGLRARARRWWQERAEAGSGEPGPEVGPPPVARGAAPPGFQPVLDAADLPPGSLVEAIVDGVPVALCNVDGAIYAVSDVCPHAGGPIGDGTLEGATVICPYHGWSFDVRDGRCFVDAEVTLPTYEAVVSGGTICVRVVG